MNDEGPGVIEERSHVQGRLLVRPLQRQRNDRNNSFRLSPGVVMGTSGIARPNDLCKGPVSSAASSRPAPRSSGRPYRPNRYVGSVGGTSRGGEQPTAQLCCPGPRPGRLSPGDLRQPRPPGMPSAPARRGHHRRRGHRSAKQVEVSRSWVRRAAGRGRSRPRRRRLGGRCRSDGYARADPDTWSGARRTRSG